MGKFEKGNKVGHRFSSEDQPGNAGRKPKLKSIPKDAQERVFAALYHALTLESGEAASMFLRKVAADLPECGFLIQVYAKGLMGKNALSYASDILDRLFGKAKQVTDMSITGGDGGDLGIRIVDTRKVHRSPLIIDDSDKPDNL